MLHVVAVHLQRAVGADPPDAHAGVTAHGAVQLVIRDRQLDVLALAVKSATISHLNVDMAHLRAVSLSLEHVAADVDLRTLHRCDLNRLVLDAVKGAAGDGQLALDLGEVECGKLIAVGNVLEVHVFDGHIRGGITGHVHRDAGIAGNGVAAAIQRDVLADGEAAAVCHVCQQSNGPALCSQTDRVGQRLVLLAADRGDIVAFLDAVGAVRVLGGDEAIGAIGIGNTLVKRTAGDLEVVRGGIADTAENVLPR